MCPIKKTKQKYNYLSRCFLFLIWGILFPATVFGIDALQLSKQIANSLNKFHSDKYSTLAFSRIQGILNTEAINQLIDYTNVALVRGRKYRVVDRSKLQLILQEQQFNLSGMVSQGTYKELGKLLGVDLFVYGHAYSDVLVLKAIDVQSSAIIWADSFQLKDLVRQTKGIQNLTEKFIPSLRNDYERLKFNKIHQVSFWNIQSSIKSKKIIDLLSVAITREGQFQVVDRENLGQLLEEQKLNMEDFIDQKEAKRMGELYGIDAFFYGTITSRQGEYIASMKLLNIYNGVIEWADLLQFSDSGSRKRVSKKTTTTLSTRSKPENEAMIHIPAGAFRMGSNIDSTLSRPEFEVTLKAYYIDRTEVSNLEYQKFVKKYNHRTPPSWPDKRIRSGEENRPVVMVNWEDANRYCKAMGKRLPTEAEWEKAYRGTDGRKYPWGNSRLLPGSARTIESGILHPQDVESTTQDISGYGILHLAGNVREWISSHLRPYPGSRHYSNKYGHDRVIRGGSWAQTKKHSTGWYRDSSKQIYAWKDVGFRCAKDAK